MADDIRDKPSITHSDVTALNFIRSSPGCVFRRHYRQGLRSHIMEILHPNDVQKEQSGVFVGGVVWFPKALPRKMFRIFRTRLRTLEEALMEIGRVKLVERYLAPDFMATSTECIVDYRKTGGRELLLCGFQAYVQGEILDPWTVLTPQEVLPTLYRTMASRAVECIQPQGAWIRETQNKSEQLVERLKRMITEIGHVPDLAGTGNLMITVSGSIVLVDINNISPVDMNDSIFLDEKGYPVCDKSIEALSLIENKILGRPIDRQETVYRLFLDPERRAQVKRHERRFWKTQGGWADD